MNTIKAIGITLTLFFAPVVPLILLVLFAIFLDTVFGIIASKKLGKKIESRKLSRIAIKSFIYLGLLFFTYGIDYVLLNELMMIKFGIPWLITKGAAVIICIVEGFSIDEKIRQFNNGKGIWFYLMKIFKSAKAFTKEAKDFKDDTKELLKYEDDNTDSTGDTTSN